MTAQALFLVDCAAKSTVLLTLAWLGTSALRRSPTATRHLVWLTAYVAILLLPLAQATIPGRVVVEMPVSASRPASPPTPTEVAPRPSFVIGNRLTSDSKLPGPRSNGFDVGSITDLDSSKPRQVVTDGNPDLLWRGAVAVWGTVSAMLALYGVLGIALAHRNRAGITTPELMALAGTAGIKRPIRVRMARRSTPGYAMTYGVLRPVILLPQTVRSWPAERLRSVLMHELAHVRRLDWLWQSLVNLACSLHWFNPLAWIGAHCLRTEAESAADDFVLSLGCPPSAYARDLLEVAAGLGPRRRFMPVTGVTAMKSPQIEHRIQAILEPGRTRRGTTGIEMLAAIALAAAVLVPLSIPRTSLSGPGPKAAVTSHQSNPQKVAKHRHVTVKRHSKGRTAGHVSVNVARLRLEEFKRAQLAARRGERDAELQLAKAQFELSAAAKRQLKGQERDLVRMNEVAAAEKATSAADLRALESMKKAQASAAEAQHREVDKQKLEADVLELKAKQAQAEYEVAAAKKGRVDALYRAGALSKVEREAAAAEAEQAKVILDVTQDQAKLDARQQESFAKLKADAIAEQVKLRVRLDQIADRGIDVHFAAKTGQSILRAKKNLASARSSLERKQALYRQGALGKSGLESAKKDLIIAELNLRIAELEAARGK